MRSPMVVPPAMSRSEDLILTAEANGRIADANANAVQRLGYARDELLSLSLWDVVSSIPAEAWDETWETIRRSECVNIESELLGKDGFRCMAHGVLTRIPLGETGLACAVLRDVAERTQPRDRLTLSEHHYQHLLDGINDAIIVDDARGRIVFANRRFREWFGLGDGDLHGVSVEDHVVPESRAAVRERRGRRMRGEPVSDRFEYEGIRGDGTRVWLEALETPIVPDRAFVGTQSAIRDVTRSRRAEEAARESTRFLLSSQRVARLGSYQLDVSTGIWTGSLVLDEILGLSDSLAPRTVRTWLGIVHPGDRDDMAAYLEDTVLGKRRGFDREYRIVRGSDGATRWVHGLGELVIDQDDHVVEMIGTIQDVTERKKQEEALWRSEGRHRALLKGIPDVMFLLDRDGVIVDFHRNDLNPFPVPIENVLGRPLRDLMPADVVEEIERAMAQAWAKGEIQVAEFALAVGTERRSYEARIVLMDEGTFTVVTRDVTQNKVLEAQLRQAQKMEAVGQLTGGLAHDFNNILTVIIGNAELIVDALPRDASVLEDMRELLDAARRGATMVSRLLQFSRRGVLRMESARPGAVIGDLQAMLERLLPESVKLRVVDTTDESDVVLLDAEALEQMLVNLCTNARDAMPAGGSLRIECARAQLDEGYLGSHPWVVPGPYLSISVTDTGSGMDQQTRERIFEPFFTTKPPGEGTGLGLAMVYGLMKRHRGMVHVYSEPGLGTTVRLYLPVTGGTPAARTERRTIADPRAAAGGTETILLAEDEPAIRRTTRRALEAKGYTVLVAEDGEAALELYRQHRDVISLVITDLVMPNIGGRQLVEAIRQGGGEVAVLFTSGYSPSATYGEGIFPAGTRFLTKPWTLSELFATVSEILEPLRETRGGRSSTSA
ncbi:MAG TPA: PAS domain S-box protein [Gemmatimonadales bacterium]